MQIQTHVKHKVEACYRFKECLEVSDVLEFVYAIQLVQYFHFIVDYVKSHHNFEYQIKHQNQIHVVPAFIIVLYCYVGLHKVLQIAHQELKFIFNLYYLEIGKKVVILAIHHLLIRSRIDALDL